MNKEELIAELEMLNGKDVNLLVKGFVELRFVINKLKFEIKYDILMIHGETADYFTLNINQISKICSNESVKVYTDSDLIIQINEIKKAC